MNINWDIAYFDDVDILKEKEYPLFLKNIKFDNFRHIPLLEIVI